MSGLVYMDDDFDWQIDEDGQPATPGNRRSGIGSALRFWMAAAVLLLVLGGIGITLQRNSDRLSDQAQGGIQSALDAARDACRAGDGLGFFASQSRDPQWQAALLQPHLFAAYCAGPTVTRVEPVAGGYSANITWLDDGIPQQRLVFFQPSPLGMVQTAGPTSYWGTQQRHSHAWGELVTTGVDVTLAPAIGRFVDDLVTSTCAATDCLAGRLPFELHIRADYQQTAAPNQLYVPSPRLLALDEAGQPAPVFWAMLEDQVLAQITPGTIRFAVPPLLQQVILFEREAAAFMQQHPGITVEVIPLSAPPDQPSAELAIYDGAAYTPSAGMVAAGYVRDLSDYVATDPDLDSGDFYEQIWQSPWWRDRFWFMPQAGQMRVLFVDCRTCEQGIINPPSLRWTWDEMEASIRQLIAERPSDSPPGTAWTGDWALLDTTRDSLLSYAYSQQTVCAGIVPARCKHPLGPGEIAAALGWYERMTGELAAMPDLAGLAASERSQVLVNWQSERRRAAFWIDEPVNYEHQLQLGRIGVVPFPGSARFDGNTPFWVHGSFISQSSTRPLDVWRWLVFLSQRNTVGPLRYVPARPSVADKMAFWTVLPAPLGEAMRSAFPFARPVSLEDREQFSRAQVESIASGALSPEEAARQSVQLPWFSAPGD